MLAYENRYQSPTGRWAGLGPYYAMFPTSFANKIVSSFTTAGDTVIDPFAGRGTSLFSSASQGRHALGVEINPVGWVYSKTKLDPAPQTQVEARLAVIADHSDRYKRQATALSPFFHRCFSREVRRFLLAARRELNWRGSSIDRTAMAFILVNLHGKRDFSLSNQMRQTKSMAPGYALRWWEEHNLAPPVVDPLKFLLKRVEWRYKKGTPSIASSTVYLGDATNCVSQEKSRIRSSKHLPARLLFTSPPYLAVTNYHYDQWLRLWLLGGRPDASRSGEANRGKFEDPNHYKTLLTTVFSGCAKMLHKDAVVYVRTHRRTETLKITLEVLRSIFPKKQMLRRERPFSRPTQTRLFANECCKEGEVDLIFVPSETH